MDMIVKGLVVIWKRLASQSVGAVVRVGSQTRLSHTEGRPTQSYDP